jgi:polysaccharide biosynthesis protein PslG
MVHRPFEQAPPSGTRKPLGEDQRRLASEAGRLPLNCGRAVRSIAAIVPPALRRFSASLSVVLLSSFITSCSNGLVYKDNGIIPGSFFGMTVLNSQHVAPPLSYGTTRTWDSFPMLDWAEINTSAGVYHFQELDAFIQLSQKRGAEVIYTFGRTPRWASSKPDAVGPYGPGQCAPPADLQYWDHYVTAIASHAGVRISYWELWNEPQDSEFYCGDMQTIVAMAQHAYRIIKSINPAAQVLTPTCTASGGPAWLGSYLSEGGGDYADIMSFHGYWNTEAESINTVVSRYQEVLAAHGQGSKPLWDTEGDWAGDPTKVLQGSGNRAAFMAKYYLLQWSDGVSRFVWYAYDGGSWGGFSDPVNGTAAEVASYNLVQQWLVGASMISRCASDSNGTWSCTLDRGGGYQALVLWNSTRTVSYQVPEQYTDLRDLTGNLQSLSGSSVEVGNSPVLVETGKVF